ncbi:Uma2 family endonuclease [Tundrisphaera sp. TA3]|uniref:Uma2 family endonuclease n=1 Tax=Tundrisphaera sp. TA3 TaxID=3435775 RepID=UPI003EBFAFD0
MATASTAPATLDDLAREPGKAELIAGRIVRFMPTGFIPSQIAANIYDSLKLYARRNRRGAAVTDNMAFVVPPLPSGRRTFSPDAAYYIGPWPKNPMRFLDGAPRFAAEVRSEGDRGPASLAEMASKRADYFAVGTLVVWDVDQVTETITVHRAEGPDQPVIYRRGDMAEAEPAVPKWRIAVDDVFLLMTPEELEGTAT